MAVFNGFVVLVSDFSVLSFLCTLVCFVCGFSSGFNVSIDNVSLMV